MERYLYGCAYYDEYMPYERLETDMRMIREAGMNVVRIAESTWACEEPQEGIFDFSHITRVIEAAAKKGISVIIGTPTYAIPPWMAAKHPEVIADTGNGREKYGRRQNMDITNPTYLFYAERIIRRLMEASLNAPNVIGVQLDNETKHYHTCGPNVQRKFVRYLQETFGTTDELNRKFGFNYWSNRIDSWENTPDPTGSINGSFIAEFEKFRRGLVTEFLAWQSGIVKEYLREDQFITHNFDYHWRGYSYGVQPDVNHKQASGALTVTGCDIYHPSQDLLTGAEIAFCGGVAYGLKRDNHIVLETQAQGQIDWLPFDGQLRIQAFSHLASGACGVLYWHWSSIHNACETYWKGVLSHDLEPNAAYCEVSTIGKDIERLSPQLSGLKKNNKVAILVSNESLSAVDLFPFKVPDVGYNDIVRWLHDALYEMNIEADVIFPEDISLFAQYKMLLVPALYSAQDSLLEALADYANNGGFLVSTFKCGFTNEYVTVRSSKQPTPDCFGIHYDMFTTPRNVYLKGDLLPENKEERRVSIWMEMLRVDSAEVIASYDHPEWGKYAGITRNKTGKGTAVYIGCYMEKASLKSLLKGFFIELGLWTDVQREQFPIIIRSGIAQDGHNVHFYFNFSGESKNLSYHHSDAVELLSGDKYASDGELSLKPWGVCIFKEN